MPSIKAFLLILFLLFIVKLFSQTLPSGPQVVTFFSDTDDTEQPYGLYIPKNYDPQKKYPLVVMLHGAGSNHRLALRRVFGKSNANGENDVEATRYFPAWKDVDYIVASPYARGTMGYQGIAEKDVMDVLADVKKRFNIDEDRTYLTGLSMGGGGSLWIGLTRPDLWAAIAPVCPAPPPGTDDLAPNVLNTPMHFFHGEVDPAVPVAVSRDWVKKLKDLGTNVTYAEYPGVGHNSWENAYADGFIFDWFSKFKRDRFPNQVRLNTRQNQYNKAYWVTIDKLDPGLLATLDVKFSGPNQLDVKATSLGGFTLSLAGHPQFKSGLPLTVSINGAKVKTTPSEKISFLIKEGKWIQGNFEVTANTKRQGAEGPLRAAFSSRHVYVYGTGGNPSEQELTDRRKLAEEAANWSAYRNAFLGRIMFFPRVASDKEVKPSDFESANLILFGTKETNAIIEKYQDRLPVHLNADAKDYGLFYTFPIDGYYVVVNSGLPWWTGYEPAGFRFMPAPLMAIAEYKDFVLFKGTSKNKLAEGYFNNNWQLQDDQKKALLSSAVVTVKP